MPSWRKFLGLFAVLHLASGTWGQIAGIKYYLATCGGQNCDTVCGTFGFQCARTGQSFPPTSALPIFESLGISCKTLNATDYYKFEDSPNYIAESPHDETWVGICLGFKSIPSTIDCQTANNSFVRRLCPCYDPSATQPPVSLSSPNPSTTAQSSTTTQRTEEVTTPRVSTVGTTQPPTTTTPTPPPSTTTRTRTTRLEKTTSETEVTTGIGHTTTEEHSTGNDVGTGVPQQQEIGVKDGAERTALIVVAVIAAGLVLCLLCVAFLFMWKRRQLSGKRGTKPDNKIKLHVEYHKNNNKTTVPDMIDGLTAETDTDETNSYCGMNTAGHSLNNAKDTKVKSLADDQSRYENTNINEQVTDNILYASIPEGTNLAFIADNNIQLYDW